MMQKNVIITKKINFYDCHTSNIIINEEIDLVLGLHSLSELSWDFFKKYFDDIITKSKYLFLSLNKNYPSPFLIKKNYIIYLIIISKYKKNLNTQNIPTVHMLCMYCLKEYKYKRI